MTTASHEADHLCELGKVVPLLCPQRMRLEESDDPRQVLETSDPEFHSIAVVHGDRTAAEVHLQLRQDPYIPAVLHDAEFGQDLPSRPHRRLAIEGDMETSLSIDKPHDPLRIQPFLLIICTHRIFTERRSRLLPLWKRWPKVRPVAWDSQTFQQMAE